MKYKAGDIVLVPAKIERVEIYGDETTIFLSSDIWDGFGEAEEKDLVPYEKPQKSSKNCNKAEKNGENRQKAVKKTSKRQQDEPISLSAYGRVVARELAEMQKLINEQ